MCLQNETPAALAPRMVNAHDDRRIGMVSGVLRAAGMVFDPASIHAEAIDRQPIVPIRAEYIVLNCVLGTSNRIETDQRFGIFQLFLKTRSDRFHDPLTQTARSIHRDLTSALLALPARERVFLLAQGYADRRAGQIEMLTHAVDQIAQIAFRDRVGARAEQHEARRA